MSSKTSDGRIVRVSRKGQATIPKRLREKFGIDAPGRVRFRETERGIVLEPIPRPSELRGSLATDSLESGEVWERLDEMRERERRSEAEELERLDE